jgi:hypothetical protein
VIRPALLLLALLLFVAPASAKDRLQEYAEKKTKLTAKGDAGGLLRLSKWCRKKGLFAEEEEALRLSLEADPAFSKSVKALAKLEEKQARHSNYETPWEWEADLFQVSTNTSEARLHYYAKAFASFYATFRKTKADFARYQRERGGEPGESEVGYYDPNEKELILFEDPKQLAATLDTLFHEGTHLLTDLALRASKTKELPLWLNEGLAEYFGPSRYDAAKGKLEAGLPSEDRLWFAREALKKGRAPNLAGLLALEDSAAFDVTEYSFAWALVHMLIEKKDASAKRPKPLYRKHFVRLYAGIAAGGDPRALFEELIGAPDDVERELLDYMQGL